MSIKTKALVATLSVLPLMVMLAGPAKRAGAAQTATPTPSPATASVAKPSDVDTVEHLLAAVYDAISGPPGPRDWDRFNSLFYPGARMIPSGQDKSGKISARILLPEEYRASSQAYFDKNGFFENSVANRIEQWDHIAQAWSTYESRHAKGEKPFMRGINSFQLINDGTRWWVVNVYWEGEDPQHQIPDKYTK